MLSGFQIVRRVSPPPPSRMPRITRCNIQVRTHRAHPACCDDLIWCHSEKLPDKATFHFLATQLNILANEKKKHFLRSNSKGPLEEVDVVDVLAVVRNEDGLDQTAVLLQVTFYPAGKNTHYVSFSESLFAVNLLSSWGWTCSGVFMAKTCTGQFGNLSHSGRQWTLEEIHRIFHWPNECMFHHWYKHESEGHTPHKMPQNKRHFPFYSVLLAWTSQHGEVSLPQTKLDTESVPHWWNTLDTALSIPNLFMHISLPSSTTATLRNFGRLEVR